MAAIAIFILSTQRLHRHRILPDSGRTSHGNRRTHRALTRSKQPLKSVANNPKIIDTFGLLAQLAATAALGITRGEHHKMKKTSLLALTAFAFLALTNIATASEKYPAADFQPTVIYSDASAAKAAPQASSEATDPKYPAANFQPTVIYLDESLAAKSEKPAAVEETAQFDAKYPAAYFQPKVIYP